MRGRYAGETGIAAAGAVEVRLVGVRVREEGAADQVAHAAGLEGPGGLEVFELEEDAAAGCFGLAIGGKGPERVRCMYHPAALDRAADSINGVETQGLG